MSETFSCPNCGYGLEVGTPTCGNCGTILQRGTAVPPPLAAGGIRPATVMTFVLSLALAGGFFFARDWITDLFQTTRTEIEGGGGTVDLGGGDDFEIGYRHVREVVRDIRAGGIPCTGVSVSHSDDIVETGSCQAGSHVQINLFFDEHAIEGAADFYREFAFASVHDANWWVSGETSLMARIQKAIGGRLHRP